MVNRIIKIVFLIAILGAIIAGFQYITPTGHLPEQITNAVSYVKTTLNWVSYEIIDVSALITCLGIIIGLQSALLFLKLTLWIIQYIG